jgi:lipoyl(octanoyl) transferase
MSHCARAARALLYDLPVVPYATALSWQRALFKARTEGPPGVTHPNLVLSLEHPPVFTLGRAASPSDLLFPPELSPAAPAPAAAEAEEASLPAAPEGFSLHAVERGGKITYHGPGQLVVYPLLDLRCFRSDLHWYVESIEEVVIRAIGRSCGLEAFRLPGNPGVWVGARGRERKIAAVGMNCSKWFTQHGFAINVCPNLAHFSYIVPCGIRDRDVTSLEREAPVAQPTVHSVKSHVFQAFSEVFDCELELQQGQPL